MEFDREGSKNTRRICRTITPINWNWQRHWFWLASYKVGCHILIRNKQVNKKQTGHGRPLRITQRGFLVATVFEPRALRLSHLNYSALTQRWNRR